MQTELNMYAACQDAAPGRHPLTPRPDGAAWTANETQTKQRVWDGPGTEPGKSRNML